MAEAYARLANMDWVEGSSMGGLHRDVPGGALQSDKERGAFIDTYLQVRGPASGKPPSQLCRRPMLDPLATFCPAEATVDGGGAGCPDHESLPDLWRVGRSVRH